jgi:hypothetical protein
VKAFAGQRAPSYLSLHEFDAEALPQEEIDVTSATPWAKKVLEGLLESDVEDFILSGGWGDVKDEL